jgi:hypothetical protein
MQPSFVELVALYYQRHYLLAPGLVCGQLGTEKRLSSDFTEPVLS